MNPVLVLSREECLVDLEPLIEVLARTFVDLSSGRCEMPQRMGVPVQGHDGWLGVMPAYVPSLGVLAAKLVTVYPSNPPPLPTHHALIVVLEPATGVPQAMMDASAITELRTAATSALAARLLARAAPSFADAVSRADVVCAATHSPDPVVRREWLRAGSHVNSVGVNRAGREVDADTVADAVVVVELRAAALAPSMSGGANELTWAIRDGVIGEDHIRAELGELVDGSRKGRATDDEITLYKGVGVAVEDAAAAALALGLARERGVGRKMVL